jgi:hypothetical protein
MRYLDVVRGWDPNRRETLKRIPRSGMRPAPPGRELITDGYSCEEFETCRQNCIKQLKRRLELFRRREEIHRREFPVSALGLEEKFAELLRIVRPKAEYPRNATYLGSIFGEPERRVIYALLEEIIEQRPWKGLIISKWGSENRNLYSANIGDP